jgi:predicted nucleic acid-binding protein
MIIFDSSVWVALFNDKDSQHEKAKNLIVFAKENSKDIILLPEHIIAETASVLLLKSSKETAEAFLEATIDNYRAKILLSDPELFWGSFSLFREKENKKLSFVDTSLLFLSLKYEVVSFDRELEKAIRKLKR